MIEPTPERERLVDAVLAGASLAIIVMLMALEMTAVATPTDIGTVAVRTIEDVGLTLDADQGLGPATQDAIGLSGRAEAKPEVALGKLKDDISRAYPESVNARLVWVALATSFRLDLEAQAELAQLLRHKQADAHRATLDALADLSSGRAVQDLAALEATFTRMGGSRWLVERLRERQADNLGDLAGRDVHLKNAIGMAEGAMNRRAASAATQIALVGIGLLVLVLFPWFVRPRLTAGGHPGLLDPSPFRVDRTRRVMLAWFLAYATLGVILPSFAALVLPADMSSETGLQAQALLIAVHGLAHGALGVMFIRRWGRRSDDHAPLGPELGLTTKPLPRRFGGLVLWALPATGVVFAITVMAIIVSAVLLGPIRPTQVALQIVISDARPETFILITLGAVVIAPVMEEILFRGFLFRNLRESIGRLPALVVSGLVFAVVHREPSLLVPLVAMGMALALLYEWSGSLLVPIAAHALWNLAQLVEAQVQFQVS